MDRLFILFVMFFLHIVDDYHLQGILANMKQTAWWQEHAPAAMYKNDWIVALLIHSFSWAFMVMLPISILMHFDVSMLWYLCFGVNLIIHAVVDHLKANALKINLITDQSIHLLQIIITWLLLV